MKDSSLLPGCHVDLVSIAIPLERSFLSFDTFQHFLWGKLPELGVFFPSVMGLTPPPNQHRPDPVRGGGGLLLANLDCSSLPPGHCS